MSFKFDESAFRREMQTQAQSAVNDLARKQTRQPDILRSRYTGRPINEIKPALQRMFREGGGSITAPELTQCSEAISAGTRIILNTRKIGW